jgi:hypothetical protein
MKEKPAFGFPFLGSFTSDRVPKATKDVYISEVTGAIPVNHTSEFQELLEGTTQICKQ